MAIHGSQEGSFRFCTCDKLRNPNGVDRDRRRFVSDLMGPPYYYHSDQPNIWCLHPVAPKEERWNFRLIQPESQVLVFRAYTAAFRISSSLGEPVNNKLNHTHSLVIFGSDGFIAGRIFVSRQLTKRLTSSYQEFVCLSRRRRNQTDDGPAPEVEFEYVPDQATLYP